MVDFPKVEGSRANGPNNTHTALTKWVLKYFNVELPESPAKDAFSALMASGGSSIKIAHDRLPLYLQHSGHSRSIVGVEVKKNGDINLLLFDPGQ